MLSINPEKESSYMEIETIREEAGLLVSRIGKLRQDKKDVEEKIRRLNQELIEEKNNSKGKDLRRLKTHYRKEKEQILRDIVKIQVQFKGWIRKIKREERKLEKRRESLAKERSLLKVKEKLENRVDEDKEREKKGRSYPSPIEELREKIEANEVARKMIEEVKRIYFKDIVGLDFPSEKEKSSRGRALKDWKKLVSFSSRLSFQEVFLCKLRFPSEVVNFFCQDFARIFIVLFMVLLMGCAFLLILDLEPVAEQVANVAYFSLVIGVLMEFLSLRGTKEKSSREDKS